MKKMISHPLHKEIGDCVFEKFKEIKLYHVERDSACGGNHSLPLFCGKKSQETKLCDVDMIIVKESKVKIIFEIEEANIKPTQIAGKFLASALSKYYHYKGEQFDLDANTIFIQIMDTSKLKENSRKKEQWKNIEKAIQNIIPVKESGIKEYQLYAFRVNDDFGMMLKAIEEFLKK